MTKPKAPGGENCTDLGNARRLVARHGSDLRHVRAWGWLAHDSRRWKRDETGEAQRRAKETARSILLEAANESDDTRRTLLARHAVASESARGIANMLTLAESEPEIAASPDAFDRDNMLLNVANGTIDLRTGELREHRREDLITRLAPVAYSPEAPCPRWFAFLKHVMKGRDDLIDFLQSAAGYSLTGDTSEQVLFFLHGGGCNGKGAFIRTLEAALGDYFRQADFATFLERHGDSIREDLADLAGARLVAASETGDGRRMAEGIVKTLTGQDTISARFLRCPRFTFRPRFKLWLAANEKPTIRGTDEGIWRRILLVPFDVSIPRDKIDHTLELELQSTELSGVLNWAVQGCLRWLEHGLKIPEAVRAATAGYRQEMDTVSTFLAECCAIESDATESAGALHTRFNAWASRAEQLSARRFSNALTERGFAIVRSGSNGSRRRIGLRLLASTDNTVVSMGKSPYRAHVRDLPETASVESVPSVEDDEQRGGFLS